MMDIKKIKVTSLLIALVILICSSFITNDVIKNTLLVSGLFLINLFIITKNGYGKKYIIITNIILIIYILTILYTFENAIEFGFYDGLPNAYIGFNNYTDTNGYYYQSLQIAELWKYGGFYDWLLGNVGTRYVARGTYNLFIIFNSIIITFWGNNLITVLLIKNIFTIFSFSHFKKIANKFCSEKYSNYSLALFFLFPASILINTQLLRDNLLIFLILSIVNTFINEEKFFNPINVISIVLLTWFRAYIGLTLIVSLVIYFLDINKFKVKSKVKILIGSIILILVIGKITERLGYGFLGIDRLIEASTDENRFDKSKLQSLWGITFWSVYTLFMNIRVKIFYYNISFIPEFLNFTSVIVIQLFSLPAIFLGKILHKDNKEMAFYRFGYMYMAITSVIVLYIFGGIVPRIYTTWFWIISIMFFSAIEKIRKKFDKTILLFNFIFIAYCLFIILKFDTII